MAGLDTRIDWNQQNLAEFLGAVEMELLPRLVADVAELAYMLAPVRTRHTAVPRWAKHGYVGRPGRLKESVQTEIGEDFEGPYGIVAALWYGRFLDPKAKQLHSLIPFLPSALEWTIDGHTYYLD
jgi:hypothetical protein